MYCIFLIAVLGWSIESAESLAAAPSILVCLMDDSEKTVFLDVLEKFRLDDKKLAVFGVDEAEPIAEQVRKELGIPCEEKHFIFSRTLLELAMQRERFAKKFRGEHIMDDLLLQPNFTQSTSSVSNVSSIG